ncbi:MAG: dephospho-CoA kinase [Clostridiales bacterium]|nr:dephospho-CoA kinase [Clostridiales bacterium]
MRLIGITGGVGAGKSEILNWLEKQYNCVVLKADEAANRIKEPGERCYDSLVELLGPEVLSENGKIDRGKMAERIFGDKELLVQVNAIIHPAVKEYILKQIQEKRAEGCTDYFFLEAALLIEEGYGEILDELWYIRADETVRRRRLRESRDYSDEKIDRILRSQLPDQEFLANCSFVIDNSHEIEEAYRQIKEKLGDTR